MTFSRGLDSVPLPATATHPPRDQSASWTRAASVPTGSDHVGRLALSDGNAVFGYASAPGGVEPDALGIWRSGAREVETLARSSFPSGFIADVAIQGDAVVYVDVDQLGRTDGSQPLAWAVRRIEIDGGEPVTLESSPEGGSPFAPVVRGGDGRFLWSVWESSEDPMAGRRVHEWRPGGARVRAVRRGIWVNDVVVPVDGGMAFTRSAPEDPWSSGMPRTDLYLWHDGDPAPRNVSRSGLVAGFNAADERLAWTQFHPATRTTGTRSDPFVVRTRTLRDSAASVGLFEGYNAGNLVVGDGWVGWWSDSVKLDVAHLGAQAPQRLTSGDAFIPARPAADGDSIVAGRNVGGRVTLDLYSVG